MFPFNNDWTNSLFFSQDPVAIDSVMYDFLYTEGTNPTEGSQNYLHQAADPPSNIYDPENDGKYLSESLGVHEHWDTNYDIFSSERYSGPSHNGIDFVTFGKEYVFSGVKIGSPAPNFLYINDKKIITFPATCIVGKITVQAIPLGIDGVEKVEFSVDDHIRYSDYEEPYEWIWETTEVFTHELVVTAYGDSEEIYQDTLLVWKFF
jgi:hypothetical protein